MVCIFNPNISTVRCKAETGESLGAHEPVSLPDATSKETLLETRWEVRMDTWGVLWPPHVCLHSHEWTHAQQEVKLLIELLKCNTALVLISSWTQISIRSNYSWCFHNYWSSLQHLHTNCLTTWALLSVCFGFYILPQLSCWPLTLCNSVLPVYCIVILKSLLKYLCKLNFILLLQSLWDGSPIWVSFHDCLVFFVLFTFFLFLISLHILHLCLVKPKSSHVFSFLFNTNLTLLASLKIF